MRVIGGREEEGVSLSLLPLTFILLELEMPMFPVKLPKLSLLLKCYKQAGALHMGQRSSLWDSQGALDLLKWWGEIGTIPISCLTPGKVQIHLVHQNSGQALFAAQTQLWSQGKAHNNHILSHTGNFYGS